MSVEEIVVRWEAEAWKRMVEKRVVRRERRVVKWGWVRRRDLRVGKTLLVGVWLV